MTKPQTLLETANRVLAYLEESRVEGPQANKQWLTDKLEDIRRRLAASLMHSKRGRPRICNCGDCATCKRRDRIIKSRNKAHVVV